MEHFSKMKTYFYKTFFDFIELHNNLIELNINLCKYTQNFFKDINNMKSLEIIKLKGCYL